MDENHPNGEIEVVDRPTAFHEAGHAIMAVLLGRPVEKVTIERNSLRLGACQLSKRRGSPIKDDVEAQALILYAGMVCEARLTGEYNLEGAAQDLSTIRRLSLMRGSSAKQCERMCQRWLDKTEYLLDDQETWNAIEATANALLEKRSLSGRAVQHIFDSHTAE